MSVEQVDVGLAKTLENIRMSSDGGSEDNKGGDVTTDGSHCELTVRRGISLEMTCFPLLLLIDSGPSQLQSMQDENDHIE